MFGTYGLHLCLLAQPRNGRSLHAFPYQRNQWQAARLDRQISSPMDHLIKCTVTDSAVIHVILNFSCDFGFVLNEIC